MPVFKQYTENSYRWGIWKTSESLEEMLALLPHKGKYEEGIGKFAAGSRRLEWLAVRVLLYTMLGEEKEIRYYSNGKPYLADGSFSISISHTKGYVAVLLGEPKKEVGIDIEYYSGRVRKVAHKFMRADEQESLFRGTETWSLLLHWSAKETMFKMYECFRCRFSGTFACNAFYSWRTRSILRCGISYSGETEFSDSLLLVSGFCTNVELVAY